EPGVPAGPGARGTPVAAALARRPPARTDRSRHRRRPGPDHAVDAAVLAGRVRDLPGDHLRRTGLPGLGRGAAFGRRTAWRAAFLVLAGTVAACRLAVAGGLPQRRPVRACLRLDPRAGAAGAVAAAARRRLLAAAVAQRAHARQPRLCRRRTVGTG